MLDKVKKALPILPIAAALAVISTAPGCGPIGCFDAPATGTCPVSADALQYFGDPDCGGRVESVDSEATLKNNEQTGGTMCCYAITNKDPEYEGCPAF